VWNDEHGYTVKLVTNNTALATSTIAAIYKARWKIELFFRNIKQLLHIKSFIGHIRKEHDARLTATLSFFYKESMAVKVISCHESRGARGGICS